MRCVARIAERLSSQRISQLAAVQQREAALAHLCKQRISQPAARSSVNGSWLGESYLCQQRISQPAAVEQQAA